MDNLQNQCNYPSKFHFSIDFILFTGVLYVVVYYFVNFLFLLLTLHLCQPAVKRKMGQCNMTLILRALLNEIENQTTNMVV